MQKSIEEQIRTLREFLTDERYERLQNIVSQRSGGVSVYLENIYQPHNASAVLRSCDAFGLQHVYVSEETNSFRPNPQVSLGSSKWLDITQVTTSTEEFYSLQKQKGHTIIATTLDEYDCTLDDIDDRYFPTTIAFGNELKGLSDSAIRLADHRMYIPMYGFVESFNISVSVALVLAQLRRAMTNSKKDWSFSKSEQNSLLLDWLKKDVHKSQHILPET